MGGGLPSASHAKRYRQQAVRAFDKALSFILNHKDKLRYEAVIFASEIIEKVPKRYEKQLRLLINEIAGRDPDNPQRRFFDKKVEVPRRAVQGWKVQGTKRVNTNRPLIEALWCDVYPVRDETLKYIASTMRDGGGYGSTHAMWSLLVAKERGCLDPAAFSRLSNPIMAELLRAQPKHASEKASSLDLYAERALFLWLAGKRDRTNHWLLEIIKHQNEDGSFGSTRPGDDPYMGLHTTMVCAWFIAVWLSAYGR